MRAFRTIYYLPSIMVGVGTYFLWMLLLNPANGLVNSALALIGIKGPAWLTDPNWTKPAIVLMHIWGLGGQMLLYLARLQSIPQDYYEAASLDGANGLQKFFKITVPLLSPIIFYNLTIGIIGAFQVFQEGYIFSGGTGNPAGSLLFYNLHLWNQAFKNFKTGYANATGREVTDILPWFERRTMQLSQNVSEEEDARCFAQTGLHNSFKYGIYKFLWLLEDCKQERSDAIWLSVCDYIIYKLTGRFVTEPGFAARTYVYDIVNNCWDIERIRAYGMSEENFPTVVPSGSVAGSFWADGKIYRLRLQDMTMSVRHLDFYMMRREESVTVPEHRKLISDEFGIYLKAGSIPKQAFFTVPLWTAAGFIWRTFLRQDILWSGTEKNCSWKNYPMNP